MTESIRRNEHVLCLQIIESGIDDKRRQAAKRTTFWAFWVDVADRNNKEQIMSDA
jgi:hypothetical protein